MLRFRSDTLACSAEEAEKCREAHTMRRLALPKDFDTDSAPTPNLLRREAAGSTEVLRTPLVVASDLLAPPAACLHRECQGVVGRDLVAA